MKPEDLANPAVAVYYGVLLSAAGETQASKDYLDKSNKAFLLPEELALVTSARKVELASVSTADRLFQQLAKRRLRLFVRLHAPDADLQAHFSLRLRSWIWSACNALRKALAVEGGLARPVFQRCRVGLPVAGQHVQWTALIREPFDVRRQRDAVDLPQLTAEVLLQRHPGKLQAHIRGVPRACPAASMARYLVRAGCQRK